MRAITITKRFPGKGAYFQPGAYLVPEQMTEMEARLAVTDGYGKQLAEQKEVDELLAGFRRAAESRRKGSAPEDKSAGAAPENKQAVGDGSAGGGSGERSEPAGARSLTTRSVKGARSSGK